MVSKSCHLMNQLQHPPLCVNFMQQIARIQGQWRARFVLFEGRIILPQSSPAPSLSLSSSRICAGLRYYENLSSSSLGIQGIIAILELQVIHLHPPNEVTHRL